MILADKIIKERKKNGWSQEELAEMMGVSRQAVSKWEGAQSVPDLNKILKLSEIFGVSTDYLLREGLEIDHGLGEAVTERTAVRVVTIEEAQSYMAARQEASPKIALGVFMCILSPVALFILLGLAETEGYGVSEALAVGLGLGVLGVIVAMAVGLFILAGRHASAYEFLENDNFEMAYGLEPLVRERKKAYGPAHLRSTIIGVILCILAPFLIILGGLSHSQLKLMVCLSLGLLVAGVGVYFLVRSGVIWTSYQKLLQEDEYRPEIKRGRRENQRLINVYWPLVVALYLALSFTTNAWHKTWIIWPVAGVIFPAILAFVTKEK